MHYFKIERKQSQAYTWRGAFGCNASQWQRGPSISDRGLLGPTKVTLNWLWFDQSDLMRMLWLNRTESTGFSSLVNFQDGGQWHGTQLLKNTQAWSINSWTRHAPFNFRNLSSFEPKSKSLKVTPGTGHMGSVCGHATPIWQNFAVWRLNNYMLMKVLQEQQA